MPNLVLSLMKTPTSSAILTIPVQFSMPLSILSCKTFCFKLGQPEAEDKINDSRVKQHRSNGLLNVVFKQTLNSLESDNDDRSTFEKIFRLY